DIEVKVSALVDKVSSPVLSDVTVTCEAAEVYDVYPRQMPDLFKGSQLVVVGRYRGEGRRTVRLSGRCGGARRGWPTAVDHRRVEERNDSVRQVWASRKVSFLLDDIRMAGESKELVDEIRRLGREYGVVTPYTSFLVVEEAQRLASARGVSGGGGGGLRFADLDGDGRADVAMAGTGGVATGNESPDSFVGFALRERALKDEAEQGLKSLGYLTSGADAVDGSRQVLEGKLAYSPAPSPARTS